MNKTFSMTQVTIFVPSVVTATGPPVYKGAMERAFLYLLFMLVMFKAEVDMHTPSLAWDEV